jgi:hypothetical protein
MRQDRPLLLIDVLRRSFQKGSNVVPNTQVDNIEYKS